MKHIVVACSLIVAPVTAFAGCSNFEDNLDAAPSFQICFSDVCDVTVQEYECANINRYLAGYAIGWSIECTVGDGTEETCVYSWQGRKIDPAKSDLISITPIN